MKVRFRTPRSCPRVLRIGLFSIFVSITASGCAMEHRHDHARDVQGKVFYLDGAGGGSVLTNWGGGLEAGLADGGYPGAFENHTWQTGLGVVSDQEATVEYKREKAKEVAREIVEYRKSHDGAPANLIGLSAGTAVAVFVLEELPAEYSVDSVILLGASISNHYDLSKALTRVNNQMYVFTSENDAVLRFGVSAIGTADREQCGACSAGLSGFHLPADADAKTRALYSKVVNIEWRPEFAEVGDLGGHTDTTNRAFVRQYLAPLLKKEGPQFAVTARPVASPSGK